MTTMLITLALICTALPAAEPHATSNPVYRQLLEAPNESADASLAPPVMADGLDEAAQRKAIEAATQGNYSFDVFTRRSVVAPQVLTIKRVAGPSDEAPTWNVHVVFVAYGTLDSIANKKFIESLLSDGDDDTKGSGTELARADLAKRGILIAPETSRFEGYGYGSFDLLNRVKLSGTTRSYWSRSDDSIVAASLLDPRFADDAQFPNHWQPLTRGRSGKVEVGPPQPYGGAGNYIKMTRLEGFDNALFVECHLAYVEPKGWFNGQGLLRSKLPAVVQNQVRNFRRKLLKVQQ